VATEFLMPKLGLTMEEGTIREWLVPDGAEVLPGMAVMSIETDKVESEVESPIGGRLHHIAAVGDTFPCGAVIALLLDEGEAAPAAAPSAGAPVPAAPVVAAEVAVSGADAPPPTRADGRLFVSPNARRVAALSGIDVATLRGTGPGGRIVSEDVEEAAARPRPAERAAAPRAATTGTHVPASVAARQLADLLGVDLTVVQPDPIEGYITRESVARWVRAKLQPGPTPSPTPAAMQTPTTVQRLSGMRGTIAKRMHASLHEMAQLTLTMDADMDAVVADRTRRKSDSTAEGSAPGYTDYVVAAAARALRRHPALNAQVTAEGIAQLPDVHVGLAVALDEGLLVPVVRHADRSPLAAIAAETTRLATAARAGKLGIDDLEGGTFSVTALGMFGVDVFTPVINPPNVAILGVGRLRDDLVLADGVVESRTRLTLSLTWDHRALDGAPAAAFCQTIVQLLADPAQLD
jgi:pyruvate dehydrogenase E2 component (dihydrolipoamide acetyltransferase)